MSGEGGEQLKGEDAEVLVARLEAREDAVAANALLRLLHRGAPTECVERLVRSRSPSAVRAGVWIASELGRKSAPLLGALKPLLKHPDRYVRFFAVEAVWASSPSGGGSVMASVVESLADEDSAVRWKAIQVISRSSTSQLGGAVKHVNDLVLREYIGQILEADSNCDASLVSKMLLGQERAAKLCGVVAAIRVAGRDLGPLRVAAKSVDPEVASCAKEALEAYSQS